MSTARRTAWSWPGLLLLLPSAGCSLFRNAEAFGVEHADTFSGDALASSGLILGGVLAVDPTRLARESSEPALAAALCTRLREAYPEMRVVMPASVEQALGSEPYGALAASFRRLEEIPAEVPPALRQQLGDSPRYLLLGVVESDVARPLSDGRPSRTTTMFFALHDLQTDSVVWQGHLQAHNYSFHANTVEGQAELIYDALVESLFEGRD